MATIAYLSSGDFSTAVPKKVVAGYFVPYVAAIAYGGTALNVERTQAFTPSEAGNCTGVWLLLNVCADATQSVTVKLQELVGGTTWTDRASKAMTYTDIYGTHYTEDGVTTATRIHYCSTYFEFTSPYAITTDAGIWRISVQSTNSDAAYMSGAGGMVYGIVSDANTSYASGDYVITKQGITMTIDQDLTLTSYFPGTDSILTWENPPVASYAFTLTNYYSTAHSKFIIGSEASPIPYAQKAVVTVTTFQSLLAWTYGGSNTEVEFWGEIPDAIQGTVAQNEATGQATITLTEDLSSSWQVGDSIHILGSTGTQIRTIQSVVGNVVTFTSNLGAVYKDWRAINVTRCTYYGITWAAGNLAPNNGGMDVYRKYSLSGIYLVNGVLVLNPTYTSATIAGSTALIEPLYIDNIYSLANGSIDVGNTSNGYNTGADRYYGGGTISNIYHCTNSSSHNSTIRIMMPCVLTISHLYADNYVYGIYIKTVGSTVSDCQVSSSWNGYGGGTYYGLMAYDCYSTEFNDIRVSSLRNHFSGAKITVNRFVSDNCLNAGYGAIDFIYSVSGITFNDCNVGSGYTGSYAISNGGVYVDAQFNNLIIGGTTELIPTTNPANLVEGSRMGFDTYNATTNDHRNYYKYGEIYSTGDGLTDTTVHTSGTGKFALRFEPKSSTDNLEWEFNIPTGDIQNKTMTVGVWCKINSATYYAGTHQLPRLTIDYDNGTTAYCQAGESTDWQLLFVTFTPATTYGQITVTLSGRTDATTTDAYIYFDDFTVAYPPSVALDLGGLDNWADALPVTPPIALPISAGTVATNVWQQLKSTDYGTGTMGTYVKNQLELNDVILGK